MTERRMLLMSSSRYHTSGYLTFAQDQYAMLFGEKKYEILFIPYANIRGTYDEYEEKVAKVFEPLGHKLVSIHRFADKKAAVANAQAIAVGGGNTFALMKRMYEDGIVEAIADRVNAGAPYVGWSAGGNVAGPSIRTTNDMPVAEPPTFKALGLIPFQTNPHFISGTSAGLNNETREDRLAEFLAYNPQEELIALPEGMALFVTGQKATVVGPEDTESVLWFRQKQEGGYFIEYIKRQVTFDLSAIAPGKTLR